MWTPELQTVADIARMPAVVDATIIIISKDPVADVNEPAYYGLVSNVAGRTPDLVVVPRPGVVFASPGKKRSEHGGLMKSDVNVALMVYAPELATAGTVYNSTVGACLDSFRHLAGLALIKSCTLTAAT